MRLNEGVRIRRDEGAHQCTNTLCEHVVAHAFNFRLNFVNTFHRYQIHNATGF